MTDRIRIAIQKKGRLNADSVQLFQDCGLKFTDSKDHLLRKGRNSNIDLLCVRDDDIPSLTQQGVCALGVVGANEYEEQRLANPEENFPTVLRELNFGVCKLAIAVPEGGRITSVEELKGKKIATSYPALTQKWIQDNGLKADIMYLSGSVEVAPSLGCADAICDLVSTGQTLRAHKLSKLIDVFESKALLIANPDSISTENGRIQTLLKRIDGVLKVNESKYVMLHAPKDRLEAISQLLPGSESPTILPLSGNPDTVAVHAVCGESVFWEHLEELKSAGASSILVLPVEKMMA